MAFGGTITNPTQGAASTGAFSQYTLVEGATLAAFVGAPAIAAADTGELTTAAPGANQNGISSVFGRGRGNWQAGDEKKVVITVNDDNAATQGGAGQTSLVHVVAGSPRVVAGDLLVTLHNRGLQASGNLRVTLQFLHTLVQ